MNRDAETTPLDERIEAAWSASNRDTPEATIAFFERLYSEAPDDATPMFELASAYDWVGREDDAVPLYEAALAAGLEADRDRRARIQLGSSLRNVRRFDEAVAVLDDAHRRYPSSAAVRCFLALALADAGQGRRAAGLALDAALQTDTDLDEYRHALARYATDLE